MFDTLDRHWQIPILDATAGDCRWPADMDNDYSGHYSATTHYCGRPVLEGKVYCGVHAKMAYNYVPTRFVPRKRGVHGG